MNQPEPFRLTITDGPKVLDVTLQTLTKIETWLRMQLAWDLAQARKSESKIPGIALALIARYRGSRFRLH